MLIKDKTLDKPAEKVTDKSTEKSVKSTEEATTVGMYLKYTRLNQKKTLDAVSKALCIRKIYIKAIEDSDFDELPPIPYGTGFVRSYANYLGLNSDRIVQCYKEEAFPHKNDHSVKIVKKHTPLTIPNKKQILLGILAIVCIYLLWLLISFKSSSDEQKPTPSEDIATVELVTPENNEAVSESSQDQQDIPVIDETGSFDTTTEDTQVKMVEDSYYEEPQTDNNETINKEENKSRVVLKLNGESWVEVKGKDKVYISGIYQKGFEYNVPNEEGLILSVGRYYNVDVFVDGKLTEVAHPKKQTNISLDKFLGH